MWKPFIPLIHSDVLYEGTYKLLVQQHKSYSKGCVCVYVALNMELNFIYLELHFDRFRVVVEKKFIIK